MGVEFSLQPPKAYFRTAFPPPYLSIPPTAVRPIWEGVSTDSLKFYTGPPCLTFLCPQSGPPAKRPYICFWGGLPAGRAGGLQPSSTSMDTTRCTCLTAVDREPRKPVQSVIHPWARGGRLGVAGHKTKACGRQFTVPFSNDNS
jgi:hypothetical protein